MSKTPFLTKIGLSEDEQKVYLALLALGPLSIGEMAKYSGVSISKVKKILDALFERNYAYKIDGLVDKAIGLYPFKEIAAEAEKDAQKIDQLIVELKGYITETIKHLEQVMAEAEQFVKSEKKKNSDIVANNSTETRKTIDTTISEATNSISSSVDATKKNIAANADAFQKQQTDNITTFESTVVENMDTFSTKLKAQAESSLSALNSELKGNNESFLTEGTSALEDANTAINTKSDSTAEALKGTSQDKLGATKDKLLTGLDGFANEANANVSSLNQETSTATEEQQTHIKQTIEKAKDDRLDRNNLFKEGIAESFETVKSNIKQDLSDFEGRFNAKLAKIADKFKQQIEELRTATAEDIKLTIEEANTVVENIATKHNEEIATNVDLDNTAIVDGTASMITKVENQNSTAMKAIKASVDKLNSSINLLKANYSANVNSEVEETVNALHTTIDTSNEEIKEEYTSIKTKVVDDLTTLTNGNSTKTQEATAKETQAIKSSTDSLVSSSKKKLGDSKNALVSGTKEAKQKIASDATGSVTSIGTTAKTAMSESGSQAKTSIRNNEETTIKAIDTITGIVEDSIRKEITTAKGSLDSYGKRFAKDAAKIAKILMEFRAQHDNLLTTVTEYPKPRMETAILYSKEAIFSRLEDILVNRIKSNVTMVVPDPTDIPTKVLPKVKAQAKITIISKIDEVQHKGIIDDIRAGDALERIKIRKIGMQDMLGYSEYIAFDIDGGEEMLIAFKDESEKQWVGVLSLSDGFKNVVIGETLGRQALSISRELK